MPNRYLLQAKTGLAAQATDAEMTERLPWDEKQLGGALVLNPELLDVEGHIPIALDGGSTQSSPDLLFVDELGQVTVVELKRVRAKAKELAQLLSYGFVWGQMSNGEADRCIRCNTAPETAQDIIARDVQYLVDLMELPENKVDSVYEAAHRRLRPAWTWADTNAPGLQVLADKVFGPSALSLPGVAPRLILVAPSFDEECLRFAALLAERQTNVKLIQAGFGRGNARASLLLDWQVVQGQAHLDRCWAAFRASWRSAYLREHFTVSAWTDRDQLGVMTLAAKGALKARVWLSATPEGHLHVSSRVPHNWYSNTAFRRNLTTTFATALAPEVKHEGMGDYGRTFPPGADLVEVARCVEKVGRVLVEHVVPHEPPEPPV